MSISGISADAYIEASELTFQAHIEDFRDTSKFALLLLSSLADEHDRWDAAARRHDWAAADQSAAEMRDLIELIGVATDHIRSARWWHRSHRGITVTDE